MVPVKEGVQDSHVFCRQKQSEQIGLSRKCVIAEFTCSVQAVLLGNGGIRCDLHSKNFSQTCLRWVQVEGFRCDRFTHFGLQSTALYLFLNRTG
mgnify:CR=1 FL=1